MNIRAQAHPASVRLLLYTGCRIGELAQLRGRDVIIGDEGVALTITPEAGTVKTRQARLVPLHPRILDLGFLAFVRAAGDGPLFFDLRDRRNAAARTPQASLVAGKLARWSRTIGLGDHHLLRPLHALRHRFMTLARLSGIEEQYAEAIAGHASPGQNRRYGEFPITVLHREIRRLDPLVVEAARGGRNDPLGSTIRSSEPDLRIYSDT